MVDRTHDVMNQSHSRARVSTTVRTQLDTKLSTTALHRLNGIQAIIGSMSAFEWSLMLATMAR